MTAGFARKMPTEEHQTQHGKVPAEKDGIVLHGCGPDSQRSQT